MLNDCAPIGKIIRYTACAYLSWDPIEHGTYTRYTEHLPNTVLIHDGTHPGYGGGCEAYPTVHDLG